MLKFKGREKNTGSATRIGLPVFCIKGIFSTGRCTYIQYVECSRLIVHRCWVRSPPVPLFSKLFFFFLLIL